MGASEYIPRLDIFRALAAFGVVHTHYFASLLPQSFQVDASLGVAFFFVLSGYLITGILIEEPPGVPSAALRRFYIRRSFRIFPLYCFVLLIGIATNITAFRASLPGRPSTPAISG
jgi:peptidoglycan/LPS O-acetylase OafA/YrhL